MAELRRLVQVDGDRKGPRRASWAWPSPSGLLGSVVVLVVLQEHCDTGRERVGPADLAELGRDLPVIQAGIITAFAADDFERAGVIFRVTGAGTGWLAPEHDRPVRLVPSQ